MKLSKTIKTNQVLLQYLKLVTLFDFPRVSTKNVNLIIKFLNPKKATGPDDIHIKLIKTVPNVNDPHLANIITGAHLEFSEGRSLNSTKGANLYKIKKETNISHKSSIGDNFLIIRSYKIRYTYDCR